MGIWKTNNKISSVSIAKDRLKSVLVADRVNCTPDALDNLEHELYRSISKYIEVDKSLFRVRISKEQIYIKLTGENS